MADEITVTELRPEDRGEWEALFRGYMAFYKRDEPPELYERCWGRLLDGTVVHARVARDGTDPSRLLGLVHFLVHPTTSGADVCYLQDLFTVPEARGRGVGKRLIKEVEGWARARGDVGRVYWLTHEDNATARRLYDSVAENKGFIRYQIDGLLK